MPTINGTEFSDNLLGTNVQDFIFAKGGNDFVQGLSGDDHLSGGSDNDTLLGGIGNDTLDGGSGNDRLQGTTGGIINGEKDRLVGRGGADQFVLGDSSNIFYRGLDSFATIRDFNRSDGDKVILRGSASDYKVQVVNGGDMTIRLASDNNLIAVLEQPQNFSLGVDVIFV
ncbi:MAG: calcium-binding protein [Leptolyngbyaceae cyanobacterium RU_5_1]|nr:calcium-binding protein [Leptolyngbyaceae cyanobacterium RU_5_1]